MGLISTIKELLGMDTREPTRRRDVEVTVERETTAESERAVKEPVASASTPDEPAEEGDAEEDATAEAESDVESEDETPPTAERDSEAADEALETIKGIGDAYAERLAGAGVENVGDLAEADAEAVADEADVPRTRLERWIDRANSRL